MPSVISVVVAEMFQRLVQHVEELGLVRDQVVRRGDDESGVRVVADDGVRHVGDAGRRIATHGFAEDPGRIDVGQLLADQIRVLGVRHDVDRSAGDQSREAVEGRLDQRLAEAENVDELLRLGDPALRPESAADAAGHDRHVGVAHAPFFRTTNIGFLGFGKPGANGGSSGRAPVTSPILRTPRGIVATVAGRQERVRLFRRVNRIVFGILSYSLLSGSPTDSTIAQLTGSRTSGNQAISKLGSNGIRQANSSRDKETDWVVHGSSRFSLQDALQEFFGFDQFKGNQEAIIANVLEGKDTFVIMPSGGGKSLCYQLPALLSPGTAIVISPLIALMKNQVDQIRGYSKSDDVAHFLNSSLSKRQVREVKEAVEMRRTKMLYVAPETLKKKENLDFLRQIDISFVAVDEAHCISEWGHDFRPEYRHIKTMIDAIGQRIPVIALTATATPKVRADIIKNLVLEDPASTSRLSTARTCTTRSGPSAPSRKRSRRSPASSRVTPASRGSSTA